MGMVGVSAFGGSGDGGGAAATSLCFRHDFIMFFFSLQYMEALVATYLVFMEDRRYNT